MSAHISHLCLSHRITLTADTLERNLVRDNRGIGQLHSPRDVEKRHGVPQSCDDELVEGVDSQDQRKGV